MKYNGEEFMKKTKTKKGVLIIFKEALKSKGLIGDYQPLLEEHVLMMNEAIKLKQDFNLTWDTAFDKALSEYVQKEDTVKDEDNNNEKSLGKQIESILELYDNKILDEQQTLMVIRKLI